MQRKFFKESEILKLKDIISIQKYLQKTIGLKSSEQGILIFEKNLTVISELKTLMKTTKIKIYTYSEILVEELFSKKNIFLSDRILNQLYQGLKKSKKEIFFTKENNRTFLLQDIFSVLFDLNFK